MPPNALVLVATVLAACAPSPAAPPPPALTPSALETMRESCAVEAGNACARLAGVYRRAWAELLVAPDPTAFAVVHDPEDSADYLVGHACETGDPLACRDRVLHSRKALVAIGPSPELARPRTVTVVDEAGAALVGVVLHVTLEGEDRTVDVVTDIHGRAALTEVAFVRAGSFQGPARDTIVLTPLPAGGTPLVLREDPWPATEPLAALEGRWTRERRPESDRHIPSAFDVSFELPGTTGGVYRPEPPPEHLQFTLRSGDGRTAPTMNGEAVEVVIREGVIRVVSTKEREWLVPIDRDTLVLPHYDTTGWSHPYVYRRD